jgi:hypothetical protein
VVCPTLTLHNQGSREKYAKKDLMAPKQPSDVKVWLCAMSTEIKAWFLLQLWNPLTKGNQHQGAIPIAASSCERGAV